MSENNAKDNKAKESKINSTVIAGFIIGAVVGAGAAYGAYYGKIKFAEKYSILLDCEKLLKDNKVEMDGEIDKEALVNGYLESYDRYTSFFLDENKSKENAVKNCNELPTAVGSGFTVAINDDELFFETVKKGMAAAEQGIGAGDKIVSIDGELAEDIGPTLLNKLGGKDGTSCQLVLERDGKEIKLEFVRKNDPEASKKYDLKYTMIGNTLYIDLDDFTMLPDCSSALSENEYDSIIIDLRDNEGGISTNALFFADKFIKQGEYSEKSFNNQEEITTFGDEGTEPDVPIVVLTNEKTASAAETATALLKVNASAELVGTKTFGKGIYQRQTKLDEGTLKYTAGYFYVNGMDNWHGVGIEPDVEVEMDRELISTDNDVQLEKALEILRGK